MKKILPIAFIAVAGIAVAFTSCKKKASVSATCTCTYPGAVSGGDTTIKYTAIGAGYGSMSDFCNAENTAVKSVFPTGGCHL